jgi:anti-sigma-K factor RskA
MSARKDKLPMDSEMARERIQLYLYDELGVQERLEIERACDEDEDFRVLFEDEQSFLSGLDRPAPIAPPEALLAECRHNLMRAVYLEEMDREVVPSAGGVGGWWQQLTAGFGAWRIGWQPAMAAAFVAAGFLLGRADVFSPDATEQTSLVSSLAGSAEIQSVQVDPEFGQVRIVLEERKVVSGASDDPEIQRLLLSAFRESNSGTRLASLEVLRRDAGNHDVQREILRSMLEDENPGVRFEALDAVRVSSHDPEVQRALFQAVLSDPNPGMRVQAIQLLTANPNRGMVGAFQNVIEQQQSLFVQQRVERVLQDLGASVEHH